MDCKCKITWARGRVSCSSIELATKQVRISARPSVRPLHSTFQRAVLYGSWRRSACKVLYSRVADWLSFMPSKRSAQCPAAPAALQYNKVPYSPYRSLPLTPLPSLSTPSPCVCEAQTKTTKQSSTETSLAGSPVSHTAVNSPSESEGSRPIYRSLCCAL